MKLPLVGASYQERSLPWDAQRSVNLYPAIDQTGSEVSALYGTPGLSEFTTATTGGSVRGVYSAANGRAFAVSGSKLIEITSDSTATDRGNLLFSSGIVSMADNGVELFICDGINGYTFTYATNTFAQVTDPDFPSAGTVEFLDSYFIVNENDTGKFYISSLLDGDSWAALDFATAEGSPDNLLRVFNAIGQLWLLGTFTTEVWTNTGSSAFPFERIQGAKMEMGILAPHSAVEVDNSLMFLGRDKKGSGIVYKTSGFAPQRVSTHAIEHIIQDASDKDQIRAYSYQEDGHIFYVLTGGGLPTTLVYDITTGLWHERAFLNQFGAYEQHLGGCFMFAFDKLLVGSRVDGKIYQMSSSFYDDDGSAIKRQRIMQHVLEESKRIRYDRLEIKLEEGVGLQSGQGSDPKISLQLSKDGARTWSDYYFRDMGKVGQYQTKAVWRNLGIAEQMTFSLEISDPVKVALIGSYLEAVAV